MLKPFVSLLRGIAADNEAAVLDANAVTLLRQQVREAAAALEGAKREMAVAMAFEAAERRALEALTRRAGEAEKGAIAALADGREDMAEDAARLIAALEDERRDREEAMKGFARDAARLRALVAAGHDRLRDLDRGLQLARVDEALRRAGANGRRSIAASVGALRQAEETLARIRQREVGEADISQALDALDAEIGVADIERRMEAMGYAGKRRTDPKDVLARLKAA